MKTCRFTTMAMAAGILCAGTAQAGSLDPTNSPASTMHTLEEIYQKQVSTYEKVEAFVSPQTLSETTTVVNAGYYQATTLDAVDVDLAPGNIKKDVTLFGVTGTFAGMIAIEMTGQTNTYREGDDAWWSTNGVGLAWPDPRFTVVTNGADVMVTDNLTGLTWVKAPHSLSGNSVGQTWPNAIDFCNNLVYGTYSDWRLPNVRELLSLISYGSVSPALPPGHPFTGIQPDGGYWSATTFKSEINRAMYLLMNHGGISVNDKGYAFLVWPVRGGQ